MTEKNAAENTAVEEQEEAQAAEAEETQVTADEQVEASETEEKPEQAEEASEPEPSEKQTAEDSQSLDELEVSPDADAVSMSEVEEGSAHTPHPNAIPAKRGSKYAQVVLAAKRAKQLREGAPAFAPVNTKNLLTVALQELADDKLTYVLADEVVKKKLDD